MGAARAERALAVLLLPFAFLVMVGGGMGLIWLWHDNRAPFWIGVCTIVLVATLASWVSGVTGRRGRRMRWAAERVGVHPGGTADAGQQSLEPGQHQQDSRALMLEVLSRVGAMQRDLDVLMGEFTAEQRSGSGRHSGPILVDIRDNADLLDDDDFDDLHAFDDRLDDELGSPLEDGRDIGALDDQLQQIEDLLEFSHSDSQTGSGPTSSEDAEDADNPEPQPDSADAPAEAAAEPEPARPSVPAQPDPVDTGVSAGAAETADPPGPERRLRRLVRDRRPSPQWDSIPAPREPVQVIELPRDDESLLDDDDDDYFGENFDEIDGGDEAGADTPAMDGSTHAEDGGTITDEDDSADEDARSQDVSEHPKDGR